MKRKIRVACLGNMKYKSKEDERFAHEVDRINQFKEKARDDNHFRSLILNRASKCSAEKRERFIDTLRAMGRKDLAGFIQMTLKQRGG